MGQFVNIIKWTIICIFAYFLFSSLNCHSIRNRQIKENASNHQKDNNYFLLQGINAEIVSDTLKHINKIECFSCIQCNLDRIPQELFQFAGLRELNLSENALNHLPDSFARFTQLRRLSIRFNQLDAIPPVLAGLKQLSALDLEGNDQIHNIDPANLPPSLQYFNLAECNLNALPQDINKLKNLKVLILNNNQLSKLPEELAYMPQLQILDVSYNYFQQFPQVIYALQNLKQLTLSRTGLRNISPPLKPAKLDHLTYLDLSFNPISAWPDELTLFPNLEHLSISYTAIISLPSSIKNLPKLKNLDISNNQLTEISPEIGFLKQLESLSLNNNHLTDLPNELSHLKGTLKFLDISGNPEMKDDTRAKVARWFPDAKIEMDDR